MIRAAEPNDLSAICELLVGASLPTAGVAEHLGTFFVVESDGVIVGAAGFEVYDSAALVRSLVIAPSCQGHGLAGRACDHLERIAPSYGVEYLYLLTETAASFFAKRGYAVISRDAAPPEIAASPEFSEICPQSAVFMRRAAGYLLTL